MNDTSERRKFGRRDTTALGWIRIDGRSKIACRITNMTPLGGFLEVTPPAYLPYRFVLEVESSATELLCEIRHSRKTGISVRFVEISAAIEQRRTDVRLNDADEWNGTGNRLPEKSGPWTSEVAGKNGSSGTGLRKLLAKAK